MREVGGMSEEGDKADLRDAKFLSARIYGNRGSLGSHVGE